MVRESIADCILISQLRVCTTNPMSDSLVHPTTCFMSREYADWFRIARRGKSNGFLYHVSNADMQRIGEWNDKQRRNARKQGEDQFVAKRLKLLPNGSKYHKMANEQCEWLLDRFEEWAQETRQEAPSAGSEAKEEADIWKHFDLAPFCLTELSHKSKALCTEEMLSHRLSLFRETKQLKSPSNSKSSYLDSLWLILDLVICYILIMTVLAMFCVLDVPVLLCKIGIISILLIPYYLRSRHPQWPIGYWICVCYWYAIRFWDMFSNEHFFRNKSFWFCWLHSAAMRVQYWTFHRFPQSLFAID